jgi:hypothetical protein
MVEKNGLVVAMQDQGNSNWYEANNLISNSSNHDTNGDKFMDWRLPTKRELNLMYVVYSVGNAANLSNTIYWSSTERGNDDAWGQNFGNNGSEYSNNEGYSARVRAVRAF